MIRTKPLTIVIGIFLISCGNNNRDAKLENTDLQLQEKIQGLWQLMWVTDSGSVGTSCRMFYPDSSWTSFHGCYDNIGNYWFANGNLIETFINTNSVKTSKLKIYELTETELIMEGPFENDTLFYERREPEDFEQTCFRPI